MDKSYNDPAKQKSREKLREFIRKNLVSVKKSRDVRVVCLPGAGKEGEEALEVKEVYDPLGIPRSNITGIEFDPEAAARLRKADLGITIAECDAKEFFRTTEQKFDVISLDYLGQQGDDELDTLDYIAGRQTLANRGIFATVYFGSRESKRVQRRMYYDITVKRATGAINHPDTERSSMLDTFIRLAKEEETESVQCEMSTDKLRDSITAKTISTFMAGEFLWPNYRMIFKNNAEFIGLQMFAEEYSKTHEEPPWDKGTRMRILYNLFLDTSVKSLAREYRLDEAEIAYLLGGLLAKETNSYYVDNIERYYYTSNSGSSMLMDLYKFVHMRYGYFQALDEIATHYPSDGTVKIHTQQLGATLKKKVLRVNNELEAQMDKGRNLPERIYLGSSFRPKYKERISREDAIGLLQVGCTPEEIIDCYTGFSRAQLSAFKAHITMGTYK